MPQRGEWKEACEGLEAEHRDRSEEIRVTWKVLSRSSHLTLLVLSCAGTIMVHPPANDCTSIPGTCRKGAAAPDPTQPQHAPRGCPNF